MTRYLIPILLLCGVAYAGEIYTWRIEAPGLDIAGKITLEKVEPEPPPLDTDEDGTPDASDPCPADPQDTCDDPPPPPADRDGDGKPDSIDECPDDPLNLCTEPPRSEDSPTGYEPRVLWSKERQGVYSRMAAENHPLWVELKYNADLAVKGTPSYGDLGQYATIAYQATGDKKYARAAWPLVRQTLAIDPGTNAMMMYGGELAWCVEWLRPALTAEELAEAKHHVDRWALKMLGVNQPKYVGGLHVPDSDAVLGQYLSLASFDRVFGTNYLSRHTEASALTNHPVGGLAPTGGLSTIRDYVASYAAAAEGGVLAESSMYNLFTENFLIPGIVAAGSEHFPEYVALWKGMARYHIAEITPDLEENFRWGDNEERTLVNRRLNYRINVLWLLAGVLGDEPEGKWCRWMATTLSAKHNTPPAWRAYWLIDPYKASEQPPANLSIAPKMGIYLRKTADELFAATFIPLTGVQHQSERWGDFALYRGGEWVIDRPLAYTEAQIWQQGWGNNVLLCGLGAMQQRASGVTEDGMVWGETSGPYYRDGYWNPPPPFVRKCRREITRDGVNVVLRDIVDMDDPRKLPNYDRYDGVDGPRIAAADLLALNFNAPTQPTVEANAVTWVTPKGQNVRISWTDERVVRVEDKRDPGLDWTGAAFRIRLIPSGYKGGPIELVTRVTVDRGDTN